MPMDNYFNPSLMNRMPKTTGNVQENWQNGMPMDNYFNPSLMNRMPQTTGDVQENWQNGMPMGNLFNIDNISFPTGGGGRPRGYNGGYRSGGMAMKRMYNVQKSGDEPEYYPPLTPTPTPPQRKRKTPYPTMSPTATGYAIRGRDRTPTPTPWPPQIYGTPTPDYLEYLGMPMGVRELGGSSGFGFNGTGGGGGVASKRMSKAAKGNKGNSGTFSQNQVRAYFQNKLNSPVKSTKKPIRKANNSYDDSPMYNNVKGTSRGPSRSDAYISYTTDPTGEKLSPEQRGRMQANSATGNLKFIRDILSSSKIQDKVKNSLMSALAYTPIGTVLGAGMKGAELLQSKPVTDAYRSAADHAKHEVRGIQMLPKAVRAANQSALNELNGRSIGDYAIDTISGKSSSINDAARRAGHKAIDTTSNALAQGYKQRESEARNSRGIGELIGAAEALGFGDKQRKDILAMGERTAGKAGNIANIAAQYHPAVMMAHYLMNQIPSDVKSRGLASNAKSIKNKISDFIVNNGRKGMAITGEYGNKALADAGSSISNFFDKSAHSTRGSRGMSKSLKSNKKSNKYF
jgi:hypothetical protein